MQLINWRILCKKGVYCFLGNFNFLQDQANLAKQKVSFAFSTTRDLQKMLLRKKVLLGYYLKMKYTSTTTITD